MLKRLITTLLLLSFFISSLYPSLEVNSSKPLSCFSNSTLYVGGSGENNYTRIQDAINNASDWDQIVIYPNVYHENIILSKPLRLTGVDVNATIVDGGGRSKDAIVTASFVHLENLTFRRAGGYSDDALIKTDADNITIKGCIFCDARTGLLLSSSYNKVENCSFFRLGVAVDIEHSSRSRLHNLSFRNNALAVFLNLSHSNLLSNLSGYFNGVALVLMRSNMNRIENSVFFYGNENQGSICLYSSMRNILLNCFLHDNGYGVRLYNSEGNNILHSSLFYNKEGIDFFSSSHNTVCCCNFFGNNLGIYSNSSSTNRVFYNNIDGQKSFGVIGLKMSVDARFNWWGSPFGPSGRGFGAGDKMLWFFGRVRYIPWFFKPVGKISMSNVAMDRVNHFPCSKSYNICAETDSDGDLCSDQWEEKWGYNPFVWDDHLHLDPDNDGLNNVEECIADKWGSNPFHKDIFVEVDWMQSDFKLSESYKKQLSAIFERHNITLHIDDGSLGGGEEIKNQMDLTYKDLVDIYWDYFLHNNLDNPRKGIFHYVVLSHHVHADICGGFCFVGWDAIDSFTLAIDYNKEHLPKRWARYVTSTGFLHELGHTLGLFYYKFEGVDNSTCEYMLPGVWKYRNYRSCMNYEYVWYLLDYSNGKHGKNDYDDWGNIDLTFFKAKNWR